MADNKRTITKSQYYQLVGLRAVSDRLYAQLKEVEKAGRDITGEEDEIGHTMDYLAGSRDTDELLRLLEIEVEE